MSQYPKHNEAFRKALLAGQPVPTTIEQHIELMPRTTCETCPDCGAPTEYECHRAEPSTNTRAFDGRYCTECDWMVNDLD